MLDGEQGGRAPGRHPDLRVDVLDVVVGRLGRDHQPLGDLPGCQPEGEQAEHLRLAPGQAGRERWPGMAAMPGGVEDPLDGLAVEPSIGGHGSDACTVIGDNSCGNGMNPSANDAGHLIARVDACSGIAIQTYQNMGFLAWDPGQVQMPPGEPSAAKLTNVLIDMVFGAGQVGCGFESQLESWYRFLIEPDPYQTIPVVNGNATPTGAPRRSGVIVQYSIVPGLIGRMGLMSPT